LLNQLHNNFKPVFNTKMKNKSKELIPIFILIYCLIIIPIILHGYSVYLNKPDRYIWNQVEKYFIESGEYNNEPIIFNPKWLESYANDIYGLPQKFNIAETNNNFYTYWSISMKEKLVSKSYQIIEQKKIKNLFIFKLKRAIKNK